MDGGGGIKREGVGVTKGKGGQGNWLGCKNFKNKIKKEIHVIYLSYISAPL